MAIFFDTNCFSELSKAVMKPLIESSTDKIILDPVLREIQEGYRTHPDKGSFDCVLDERGRLRDQFKLLDLSACTKKGIVVNEPHRIMFKENPLLCSSYFTWLPYALRPAIITDPFRHVSSELLATIHRDGDPDGTIRERLGRLRAEERDGLDYLCKSKGQSVDELAKSILSSSRKKKTKDYRKSTLKLTDYQIVTCALIYACYFDANTCICSCDSDLCDIFENLTRCVIEKYVVNTMLEDKIGSCKDETEIHLALGYDDMQAEVHKLFERIRVSAPWINFVITRCDQSNGLVDYQVCQRIPLWLRDFILEYKMNTDCFSINRDVELKHQLRYVMTPDWEGIWNPQSENPKVEFDINVRKGAFYNGFLKNCESRCAYSKLERTNPYGISGFVE